MKRALIGLLLLVSAWAAGCTAAPAGPRPTPGGTPAGTVQPKGMNILLLGSDERAQDTDPAWRTDTLIVVGVRPRDGIVAMLSIPRDLWVTIPGYGDGRINEADYVGETSAGPGGGPALLAATLEENLGIPIHAYARIQFAGLQRIVDAMGGITVNVERPFDEVIDEGDGSTPWHFTLRPGVQRLDGRAALYYARSRKGVTDIDRSRRQQQVLLALREAALRPEILPRLPGLLGALSDAVETNLRPADALGLMNMALRLSAGSFRGRVFDESMMRDWVTPQGAMVLLPNRERIGQVWAELTAPT